MFKFFILMLLSLNLASAQDFTLQTKILSSKTIAEIIGPDPKAGSTEYKDDFDVLFHYQQNRTAQDCALASRDMKLSLETLYGGEVGILNPEEVKKLSSFLLKAYASTGANAHLAKSIYKRPRPYKANPLIIPCIDLESSYAYPSGHSLFAQLYGRIVSRVYPARAEALMKRSLEFSMNRVLGGVHHPSDVKAAHLLADYLALQMIRDKDFIQKLNSLR